MQVAVVNVQGRDGCVTSLCYQYAHWPTKKCVLRIYKLEVSTVNKEDFASALTKLTVQWKTMAIQNTERVVWWEEVQGAKRTEKRDKQLEADGSQSFSGEMTSKL